MASDVLILLGGGFCILLLIGISVFLYYEYSKSVIGQIGGLVDKGVTGIVTGVTNLTKNCTDVYVKGWYKYTPPASGSTHAGSLDKVSDNDSSHPPTGISLPATGDTRYYDLIFQDAASGQCYACPTGSTRTGTPVTDNKACSYGAISVSNLIGQSGSCATAFGPQWSEDALAGTCYSCGNNYWTRNLLQSVSNPNACVVKDETSCKALYGADSWKDLTLGCMTCPSNLYQRSASGLLDSSSKNLQACVLKTCPDGGKLDPFFGCFACTPDAKGNTFKQDIGQTLTSAKACVINACPPEAPNWDITKGCYGNCPAGYHRDLLQPVDGAKACAINQCPAGYVWNASKGCGACPSGKSYTAVGLIDNSSPVACSSGFFATDYTPANFYSASFKPANVYPSWKPMTKPSVPTWTSAIQQLSSKPASLAPALTPAGYLGSIDGATKASSMVVRQRR